ncbi:MAG: hypothetical protein E7010_00790 [Alphaproteobacteria bacterium]|nr:hypothetical protein [Alphaproteobacteria bacterium]
MTYFNSPWADSLQLDDGTIVSSSEQLRAYLREHDLSLSADYSEVWRQKRKAGQETARRKELFAAFLHNYKRSIWNAKFKKRYYRPDGY